MKKNNHTYYENVKPKRGRKVLISLTSALAVVVLGVGVAFANGGVPEIFEDLFNFEPYAAGVNIVVSPSGTGTLQSNNGGTGTSTVGGKGGAGGAGTDPATGCTKNYAGSDGSATTVTTNVTGTTSGGSGGTKPAGGCDGTNHWGYAGANGGTSGTSGVNGGTGGTAPNNKIPGGSGGGGGGYGGKGNDGTAGTAKSVDYNDSEYGTISITGGTGGTGGNSTGGAGGDGGAFGYYKSSDSRAGASGGGGGAGGHGGVGGKGGAGGKYTASLGFATAPSIVKTGNISITGGVKGTDGTATTGNNGTTPSWTYSSSRKGNCANPPDAGVGGLGNTGGLDGCPGGGGAGGGATAGTGGNGGEAKISTTASNYLLLNNHADALKFTRAATTSGLATADIKNIVVPSGSATKITSGDNVAAADVKIENIWIYPGANITTAGNMTVTNRKRLAYYDASKTLKDTATYNSLQNDAATQFLAKPTVANTNASTGKIDATLTKIVGPYLPASNAYTLECAKGGDFSIPGNIKKANVTIAAATQDTQVSGLTVADQGTYNCRYSAEITYGSTTTTVYSALSSDVSITGIDPLLYYADAKGVVLNEREIGDTSPFTVATDSEGKSVVLYDSTATTTNCANYSGGNTLTGICKPSTSKDTPDTVKLYGINGVQIKPGNPGEQWKFDELKLVDGMALAGYSAEDDTLDKVLENYSVIPREQVEGESAVYPNYATPGQDVTVYYLPKSDKRITLSWGNDPAVTITPTENDSSLDCNGDVDGNRAYNCSFGYGQNFKFNVSLSDKFKEGTKYNVYYRYIEENGSARVGRSAPVRNITTLAAPSPFEDVPGDAIPATDIGSDEWEIYGITGDIEIFALDVIYEEAKDIGSITIHKVKNSPAISSTYTGEKDTEDINSIIDPDFVINNHGVESTDAQDAGYLSVKGARFAVMAIDKTYAKSQNWWSDDQGTPLANGTSSIPYEDAIEYAHTVAVAQKTLRGGGLTNAFSLDTDETKVAAIHNSSAPNIRVFETGDDGTVKFNLTDLSTENLNNNLFLVIEIVAEADGTCYPGNIWTKPGCGENNDGFESTVFPHGLTNQVANPVIVNVPNYNYVKDLQPLEDLNYDIHLYPKNIALSANVMFNKYAFNEDNSLELVPGAIFDIYRANVPNGSNINNIGGRVMGDFDGTWTLVGNKQSYSDLNGRVQIPGPFDGVYMAVEVGLAKNNADFEKLFGAEAWGQLSADAKAPYLAAGEKNKMLLPNAHKFIFAIGDDEISGSGSGQFIPVEDQNLFETDDPGDFVDGSVVASTSGIAIAQKDENYVDAVTAALAEVSADNPLKLGYDKEQPPYEGFFAPVSEACLIAQKGVANHCETAFYDFVRPNADISIPPTVDFGQEFKVTMKADIPWDIASYKGYTITIPGNKDKFGEPDNLKVNGQDTANGISASSDAEGNITIAFAPGSISQDVWGTEAEITFTLKLNPQTDSADTELHTPHLLNADLVYSNSFDYTDEHAASYSTEGAELSPRDGEQSTVIGTTDPAAFLTHNIVADAGASATITGGKQWLKVDSNNHSLALDGAKFVISKTTDGGDTQYMFRDDKGNISWVDVAGIDELKVKAGTDITVLVSGDLDGNGVVDDEIVDTDGDGVLEAKEVQFAANGVHGIFNISGLAYSHVPTFDYANASAAQFAGYADRLAANTEPVSDAGFALSNNYQYALVEVNAPAGYQLLTKPLQFDVEHLEGVTVAADIDASLVPNGIFSPLPITGGFGVFLIIIFTVLMIIGAFGVRRKKTSKNA